VTSEPTRLQARKGPQSGHRVHPHIESLIPSDPRRSKLLLPHQGIPHLKLEGLPMKGRLWLELPSNPDKIWTPHSFTTQFHFHRWLEVPLLT
jgi:hypothetical protein